MIIGLDIRLIGKQRTGDETVFLNLTKSLAEIDSKNEYRLFTDEGDQEKIAGIKEKIAIKGKVNFEIVQIDSKNRFCWNFWDLPRYLRKNPIDVYLTQYITPFFVPRKIRIITIIHDISFNFFPKFIRKSDLLFLKILIPISLRRADKVLGVSEFTKNEIMKYYGLPSEKVGFFHNAVAEDFKNNFSQDELVKIRQKYNLPDKYVLYLGTFQPRKNIPFLIESFASIKKDLAGIKLVLVGNRRARNYDTRIDETIEKNSLEKDIFFPGFIEDKEKAAVYAMAHVFAFPSLYEGFGIPVLEAFVSGLPVLASDIPSLREVAGNAAMYASPGDIDKYSKALYDISMDEGLRNDLINSGKSRSACFSWKKTAMKLLKVLVGRSYD